MFRSNVDIQYVLDPYACVAYVLDYINKSDKGLSKAMEDIYVKHKSDPSSTHSTCSNPLHQLTTIPARYLHKRLHTIFWVLVWQSLVVLPSLFQLPDQKNEHKFKNDKMNLTN